MGRVVIALLGVVGLILGCATSGTSITKSAGSPGWKFARFSGSTMIFSNGQTWDTKLISPHLLSETQDTEGRPVLLVVGIACRDCDESPGLYLYRPNLGSAQIASNQKRYSPPGSHFDSMDNQLKEKVRVFLGHCLHNSAPEVVWHGYRIKGGKWKESYAHVVELKSDSFAEQSFVESVPDLKLIEDHVTKGECQELKAQNWGEDSKNNT